MLSAFVLSAALWAAADADEAARIEQLIHHPAAAPVVAPTKPANARAAAKTAADPAAALIGQRVRVRTVDRGAYAGTLESVDANTLVLRIDLSKQALSYSLPRHAVAEVNAESAP